MIHDIARRDRGIKKIHTVTFSPKSNDMTCQTTLSCISEVHGRGYFSGEAVTVELRPAPANTGLIFVRSDCHPHVRIPARLDYRVDDLRRTTVARNGIRVEMIEHVMAALVGMQIDNCEVWIDRAEMPAGDGSARAFTHALSTVGTVQQAAPVAYLPLTETVRVGNDEAWIEAGPSTADGLQMRYELDYSHAPAIGRQSFQATVTPQVFAEQISSARSFLLLEEAEWLRSQGLGTHVTHDEILVFDDHGPLENELRFPDECVRHKLLDLIGDLGLCGHRVTGQFTACRSGHQLNAALAHELVLTTQPAVHGRTA